MAMGQAELQILLKAKDETQRALRGSRKGFADLARAAKAGFAIAGVAAVGAGVAALKMAADFEKGMAEVATLAPNMSEETFGVLRQGVLDLSKEMGITTKEVVPALYQAISAGVPAENVLTFMKLASKAAVGGVTDLETAVDGITSVVNAYGKGVIRAQEAADIMFTGVRLGKTDFTQLSAALFNVIPTAATLGISMAEVTAALATITAQGVPTSIATTSLRAAFVEASKGGTLLDKAIREMTGKGFQGLIAGGSTAAGIFDALRSETEASGESFNDLFGSVEAMGAVLQITGPNAAKMNEALAEMGASAGAVDTAFATVSDTTSFKFGKAMNQMKVTLTEVGLKILPAATVALGWFQDAFKAVSKWIDQNREMIRETFTRIGEVVQRLWGHFRSGLEVIWPVIRSFFRFLIDNKPILIGVLAAIGVAIVMALGPVSGAVLAITGMIMVIGFLRDNWDMIKEKAKIVWDFVVGAFERVRDVFSNVMGVIERVYRSKLGWLLPGGHLIKGLLFLRDNWEAVWDGIKAVFSGVLDAITGLFRSKLGWLLPGGALIKGLLFLRDNWESIWGGMRDFVSGIWDGIVDLGKGAINTYIGFFNKLIDIWNALEFKVPGIGIGPLKTPAFTIGTPDIGRIPTLGKGAIVTSPTLALIGESGPEAVVPLTGRGGLAPVINVTVNINGTVVSTQFEEEVTRAVRDGLRRGGFDGVFAPA